MRTRKSSAIVMLIGVCALVFGGLAFAQPGPGGGRGMMLPPEKAAKATEAEAQTVAKTLGLNPDQTTKLEDAYKTAKHDVQKAMQEKMAGGGLQGREMMQARMEIVNTERGKFETALKGFLNADQTSKAVDALGGFSPRTDQMVAAIQDLNITDKSKADAALKTVMDYSGEAGKAMAAAMASGDRAGLREKMQPLNQKLRDDLSKVLTPEQMTKFEEAVPGRGMGMGGGRRGQGGGAGGPGGAPTTPPTPPTTPPETK